MDAHGVVRLVQRDQLRLANVGAQDGAEGIDGVERAGLLRELAAGPR